MTLNPSTIQWIAGALFAIAIVHTFTAKYFEKLAHRYPSHEGIFHLLGEVEVVFGFWALVLILFYFAVEGSGPAVKYMDGRNFTEPLFVFAIMVIAATRPILNAAQSVVGMAARLLPLPGSVGLYLAAMILVPLLGSFITEPAAMTLGALILARRFFSRGISLKLKYATVGLLFVNVSIGGTLTPFAAPPVLMVAGAWGWDLKFMLTQIGWKAAVAVVISAVAVTVFFFKELSQLAPNKDDNASNPTPLSLTIVHLLFLAGVVIFAHHPSIFMGLFLFFLGVAHAYRRHQDRLILREGLLVAFFLCGLIVLGGLQSWWLQPLLMSMSADAVYIGATLLTAVTDNAALTYLGSLVPNLSDPFKYALVTGAVTGGGLTVIANAPNPAGYAILRTYFPDDSIGALGIFLAALGPTLVAVVCFKWL
jgi:hypothetical protein